MNTITSSYIALTVLVFAVVAIYVLVMVLRYQQKIRKRALRSITQSQQLTDDKKISNFAKFCDDMLLIVNINAKEYRRRHYGQFGRAGLYTEQAVTKFLFVRYFLQPIIAVLGLLFTLTAVFSQDMFSLDNILIMLLGFCMALFGISGHSMVLDKLSKRRRERLVLEFPDAVDLLLICVEAGMGLDAAMTRLTKELEHTHPYVTAELERTRVELGLYGDRISALQNLAERTDIQSYRSLVSALVQTEKYGTNLAATLRVLSHDYRQQRLMRAEEKAARVGALLTLPVVIGVFFPVMALIMAPPLISVLESGLAGK